MTPDFLLGQLRIALIGFLSFAVGKGWLTTADSSAVTQLAQGLGPILVPLVWSWYSNWAKKYVPRDSIAVPAHAVDTPEQNDAKAGDIVTIGGQATRVVGCLIAALMLVVLVSPAVAQDRPRLILQPPIIAKSNDAGGDILKALDAKLLPDLTYALNMAKAAKNDITADCYQAWIEIIQARASANEGDPPQPAIITNFERAVELRNAMQPDSKFMRACSPVANMVKTDLLNFVGKIVGGGISAGMLIPGL